MKSERWLGGLWRSVHLFQVADVPIQIHTTTLVFPWGFALSIGWMIGCWTGLGIMLAVLLTVQSSLLVHEFAHVLVARRFGCETRRILFFPFGCLAELEEIPTEPGEIWVAAAGPAASALLALVFWVATAVLGPSINLEDHPGGLWLAFGWIANLGLATFNLLPCFPMDGGRILRSLLALLFGVLFPRRAYQARLTATRIAVRWVARVIALAAILATLFYTHFWHHILLFVFLVVVGEAEYRILKASTLVTASPLKLQLLPASAGSSPVISRLQPRPAWQLTVLDPTSWCERPLGLADAARDRA